MRRKDTRASAWTDVIENIILNLAETRRLVANQAKCAIFKSNQITSK